MKKIVYLSILTVLLLNPNYGKAQCVPAGVQEFTGQMSQGGTYKISNNTYARQIPQIIPQNVTLYITGSASVEINNISYARKVQVCDKGSASISVSNGSTTFGTSINYNNLTVGPFGAVSFKSWPSSGRMANPFLGEMKENSAISLCLGGVSEVFTGGGSMTRYTGSANGKSYFIIGSITYDFNTSGAAISDKSNVTLIDFATSYKAYRGMPSPFPSSSGDSFTVRDRTIGDSRNPFGNDPSIACSPGQIVQSIPGYTTTTTPPTTTTPTTTHRIDVWVMERDATGSDINLPNVKVQLYDNSLTLKDTQYTNSNGRASFSNVNPGTYTVMETDPTGYYSVQDGLYNGTPWQGDGQADNKVSVNVSTTSTYVPVAKFLDSKYGRIVVNVKEDTTGDTTGDRPLSGVTIKLSSTSSKASLQRTTDSSGNFTFPYLIPGTYIVKETDPTGYYSVADTDGEDLNSVQLTVIAGSTKYANFVDRLQPITGSILVNVKEDTNGDTTGDSSLSGVTVELYRNSSSTTAFRTGTTDSSGNVTFPNLTSGTYIVKEKDPTGYYSIADTDGEDLNSVTVTVTAGGRKNANFVDRRYSRIQVNVREDTNGDTTGDSSLSGVTVELYRNSSSTAFRTGTTDSSGNVTFPNLNSGTYIVKEKEPTGYYSVWDQLYNGTSWQGDGNPTDNRVQLTVTAEMIKYAGFVDRQYGSIIVNVKKDTNGDTTGDRSLSGVTVELYQNSSSTTAFRTGTTDSSGNVTFPNLTSGTYIVKEKDPTGYYSVWDQLYNGTSWQGDGNPTDNRVQLTVTAEMIKYAGFVDRQYGSIIVNVKKDTNGDTTGDSSLSGVTVELYQNSSSTTAFRTGTTDSSGNVTFPNLTSGTYIVKEKDPTGYYSIADTDGGDLNNVTVIVTAGGRKNANFVDRQYSSITVNVKEDTNRDTTGENPLQGVQVTIFESDGSTLVKQSNTDASGNVTFANLIPGTYIVKEKEPQGYYPVWDNYIDMTDNSVRVTVTLGGTGNANFVDRQYSSITVNVKEDTNGDTTGENDLEGVRVKLYTYARSKTTEVRSKITNNSGIVNFTDLTEARYIVAEFDKNDYYSVWDSQGNRTDNSVILSFTAGAIKEAYFVDRSNKLVCTPAGEAGQGESFPSVVGISTLDRGNDTSWVNSVKNAQLVLDSEKGGLVLPRMANPNSINNLSEGMIYYDTTNRCIKLYQNNKWGCLTKKKCITLP